MTLRISFHKKQDLFEKKQDLVWRKKVEFAEKQDLLKKTGFTFEKT